MIAFILLSISEAFVWRALVVPNPVTLGIFFVVLVSLLHFHQNVPKAQKNVDSSLYYNFHINQAIEWIIIAFRLDIKSPSWIIFGLSSATLFIECSSNFFTIEIINRICPWYIIVYFLITKTSSDQFAVHPFAKIFYCFNLRSLSLCSTS